MEISTVVNRNKSSRAVLSEAHNLIVSNIKGSVIIRSAAIKDDIAGSSISKRDRNTMISHSTGVASLPVLAIDEIVAISESRPVQPGHKRTAISNRGNSAIRADTLADTGPSAGGLGIVDELFAVDGPHGSSGDSLTVLSDVARATGRSGWLRIVTNGDSSDSCAADNEDVGNPAGSSVVTDLSPPVVRVALRVDIVALLLADGVLIGLRDRSDDSTVG